MVLFTASASPVSMLAARAVCESHRAASATPTLAVSGRRAIAAATETGARAVAVRDAERTERTAACRRACLR